MLQYLLKLLKVEAGNPYFFPPQCQLFHTKPYRVIVEPWRGRHHVYGIFMLPNDHQLNSPVFVTIAGAGAYPRLGYVFASNGEGYPVKPGYYFLRVHLRTRVALLIILRGLGAQLKQPLNWTLTYTPNLDGESG